MTSGPGRCPACGMRLRPNEVECRHCDPGPPDAPVVGTTADHSLANLIQDFAVLRERARQPAISESLLPELRRAMAPGIQVLRLLGDGGMGAVYLGRDPALKRLVAIKVLLPHTTDDQVARERFMREAQAAAAVTHPNVVGVYHVGALPRSGAPYLVMQYVHGPTLATEFPEGRVASEARARRIVGEVAAGLAAAHERGLVHRDIKPANVVIDADTGRAVVLDFGITAAIEPAAQTDPPITAEDSFIGTPRYMSPEQATGQPASDRSDVYSLGVMAYELVTGARPVNGNSALALLSAHVREVPARVLALRPSLDAEFADLIDRCLAKEPTQRPSAHEMAMALFPSAEAPLIEWPPPGLERVRALGWHRMQVLGAVVGAALGAVFLWHSPLGRLVLGGAQVRVITAGVALTALVVGTGVAVVQAGRLGARLWGGSRCGYPWPVLLDAALDGAEDTPDLINASGAYAGLPTDIRERLLRLRRVRAGLVIGSVLLGVVATLCMAAISAGGRLLLLAALLICVAGAVGCGIPELRTRRAATRRTRAARVPAELVANWLVASGRMPAAISAAPPVLAAAAAPTVVSLVVTCTLAVVLGLLVSLGP